jgi:hypothetical protein
MYLAYYLCPRSSPTETLPRLHASDNGEQAKRRRAASGTSARTAGGAGEAENLADEHKDGSRLATPHQIATVLGI